MKTFDKIYKVNHVGWELLLICIRKIIIKKKWTDNLHCPYLVFVCVYFSTGRCRQQRGSDGWHCKWIEEITDHTKPRFNNSVNEWNTPNSLLTTWTHNCRLNGVFRNTWYFQKNLFHWRTIFLMDVPWKIKTFSCG